jgi:hypothetical protein
VSARRSPVVTRWAYGRPYQLSSPAVGTPVGAMITLSAGDWGYVFALITVAERRVSRRTFQHQVGSTAAALTVAAAAAAAATLAALLVGI